MEYRKDFILFNLGRSCVIVNFWSASKSKCKHESGESRGLLSVFIYYINFGTVYFGNNSSSV